MTAPANHLPGGRAALEPSPSSGAEGAAGRSIAELGWLTPRNLPAQKPPSAFQSDVNLLQSSIFELLLSRFGGDCFCATGTDQSGMNLSAATNSARPDFTFPNLI